MVGEKKAAGGDDAVPIKKKQLKPAQKNPWYVLATVHGEQDADADQPDRDLTDKNRRIWNGWASQGLSDDERTKLVGKMDLELTDLDPLSRDEQRKLEAAFAQRLGPDGEIPDPSAGADFNETEFDRLTSFGGFIFSRVTSFKSAIFSKYADFESATFSGRADLNSAIFSKYADFDSATFSAPARFRSAIFSEYADFKSAIFSKYADFESAIFSAYAEFESAIFSEYANFASATFSGYADFASATFSGYANFPSATFSAPADFPFAMFQSGTEFSGASFEQTTNFRGASFSRQVPKFYNADIHQDTNWSAISWPTVKRSDADDAIRAYERLKLEVSAQHRHEDELNFLALEQEARAVRDGFWYSLPNHAYRVISNYGRSISRPAWSLLALWFVCLVPGGPYESGGERIVPFWTAAGLSAGNIVGFTSINRVFTDPNQLSNLPGWVKVLYGLETVLGAILIFLMLLAIRNRFRIK